MWANVQNAAPLFSTTSDLRAATAPVATRAPPRFGSFFALRARSTRRLT
jgi:hypothetical protein